MTLSFFSTLAFRDPPPTSCFGRSHHCTVRTNSNPAANPPESPTFKIFVSCALALSEWSPLLVPGDIHTAYPLIPEKSLQSLPSPMVFLHSLGFIASFYKSPKVARSPEVYSTFSWFFSFNWVLIALSGLPADLLTISCIFVFAFSVLRQQPSLIRPPLTVAGFLRTITTPHPFMVVQPLVGLLS